MDEFVESARRPVHLVCTREFGCTFRQTKEERRTQAESHPPCSRRGLAVVGLLAGADYCNNVRSHSPPISVHQHATSPMTSVSHSVEKSAR